MEKKRKIVLQTKVTTENIKQHEYFNLKNMSIAQLIALFLLGVVLIGTILIVVSQSLGLGFNHNNPKYKNADYIEEFNTVWHKESGETISDLNHYKFPSSTESQTIYADVPSNCSDDYGVSFIIKNVLFEAYVDLNDNGQLDEGEDVLKTFYFHGSNGSIGSSWNYIKLNADDAGHRLYVSLKTTGILPGHINELMYGHISTLYVRYSGSLNILFLLSIFFALTSLLFMLFSLLNKVVVNIAPQIVVLSLMSLSFSLYVNFICGKFQLISGNAYIFNTLAYLMLIFGGLFFTFYLYLKAVNLRILNIARFLIWLFVLLSVLTLLTTIFPQIDVSMVLCIALTGILTTSILFLINTLLLFRETKKGILYITENLSVIALFSVVGVFEVLNQTILADLIVLIGVFIDTIACYMSEYAVSVINSQKLTFEKHEEENARVSIMLAQIQPHFLYNALNSIAILCDMDAKKARDLTVKFSQYLRNNINSLSREEAVPFREELNNINTYLDIEKIRFANKLTVKEDIKVMEFNVPVLTIQPLVENAVKHGISKKATPGLLTITTKEDDEYFYVIINDNGVGFNMDEVQEKIDSGKSIGLSNVQYRLRQMVGGKCEIVSTLGSGTECVVSLPKSTNKVGK